ncbi:MAG: type III-B CRISPR module RAMP protein Cmr6 [Methanobacteriota archaeon]|nr:MAG: type III-B CRISPR module RAMP protein Cmr6 [Euryarchaeota archaeon]
MINYKDQEIVPMPTYGRRPISNAANMGLVFNKYFPWNINKEISKSHGWINAYIKEFNNIHSKDEYNLRYRKMVRKSNGLLFEMKCMSDLIIGMGNAHPMENGFTFDHTQGLPFIPGTTIKGIWKASEQAKAKEEKKESKNNAKEDKKVDDFVFLDAIPLSVKLRLDIMTPHYQPYYSSGGTSPPGDWYNPIPIQFITVSKGSKFLWGILSRTKDRNGLQKDNLKRVTSQIKEHLLNFGIGGKTAVGYGRIEMRKVGG